MLRNRKFTPPNASRPAVPTSRGPAVFVALFTLFAAVIFARPVAAEIVKTTVFRAGDDGYHTYRIPTIVRAANGNLLAFAEGRKNGAADRGDIDIVLKRSSDGGKTWGKLQLVQDEASDPTAEVWIGNPSPVVDMTDAAHPGRIWLIFTRSNERVFVTSSDDNGRSWSERRELTGTVKKPDWEWYATGPVHAIQLTRGKHADRLVVPCDHGMARKAARGSHLIYSDDHGATWKLGATDTHAIADPVHPDECVATELTDGRIYINSRDEKGSDPATRLVAYSSDGGESFDAPFRGEASIASPVVQNSVLRFAAKDQHDPADLLLYSGPSDPTKRRDLTIRTSRDESKTWQVSSMVHAGPAAYSDLVKFSKEEFGVLYEAGDKLYGEIIFAIVKLKDLGTAP